MTVTTLSSRALNHDVGSAKRAALNGPVIITDRGRPSHVLMSYEAYRALTGGRRSLVEALAMPGLSEIELSPPRAVIAARDLDLS
ncbi:type II toxin-antitoxin system prevent-host-death family antitoxin [Ensifer soli]|uniref:type II toxin-antitoxin system prevent-host-death family antitoxin n=1 Tax=Ciceribacter sp. sgz301302 TaxID=3342379 RepID=UPI0035B85385